MEIDKTSLATTYVLAGHTASDGIMPEPNVSKCR